MGNMSPAPNRKKSKADSVSIERMRQSSKHQIMKGRVADHDNNEGEAAQGFMAQEMVNVSKLWFSL